MKKFKFNDKVVCILENCENLTKYKIYIVESGNIFDNFINIRNDINSLYKINEKFFISLNEFRKFKLNKIKKKYINLWLKF
jgi:hypothetical protein